jgi:hypothetical protein
MEKQEGSVPEQRYGFILLRKRLFLRGLWNVPDFRMTGRIVTIPLESPENTEKNCHNAKE